MRLIIITILFFCFGFTPTQDFKTGTNNKLSKKDYDEYIDSNIYLKDLVPIFNFSNELMMAVPKGIDMKIAGFRNYDYGYMTKQKKTVLHSKISNGIPDNAFLFYKNFNENKTHKISIKNIKKIYTRNSGLGVPDNITEYLALILTDNNKNMKIEQEIESKPIGIGFVSFENPFKDNSLENIMYQKIPLDKEYKIIKGKKYESKYITKNHGDLKFNLQWDATSYATLRVFYQDKEVLKTYLEAANGFVNFVDIKVGEIFKNDTITIFYNYRRMNMCGVIRNFDLKTRKFTNSHPYELPCL